MESTLKVGSTLDVVDICDAEFPVLRCGHAHGPRLAERLHGRNRRGVAYQPSLPIGIRHLDRDPHLNGSSLARPEASSKPRGERRCRRDDDHGPVGLVISGVARALLRILQHSRDCLHYGDRVVRVEVAP